MRPVAGVVFAVSDHEKGYTFDPSFDPEVCAALLKILEPFLHEVTGAECGKVRELQVTIHF